MDHAVRTARNHDVGFARSDQLGSFADGLAARGTCCQAIGVGTLCVEHGSQMCCRHVWFLLELKFGVENFDPFG